MFWGSGANSHFLQVDPWLVEKWIYPFHVDLAPWKKNPWTINKWAYLWNLNSVPLSSTFTITRKLYCHDASIITLGFEITKQISLPSSPHPPHHILCLFWVFCIAIFESASPFLQKSLWAFGEGLKRLTSCWKEPPSDSIAPPDSWTERPSLLQMFVNSTQQSFVLFSVQVTHIFCLSISLLLLNFLPLDVMLNRVVLSGSLWDDSLLLYRNVIGFLQHWSHILHTGWTH